MKQRFGKIILKLRQKRGLTLRALESALEVSNSYISKLEKSRRLPSVNSLLKITDYFELNPLNLLQKCNDLPETLIRETKLKIYDENPYESRVRATLEVDDPKLKRLCLPFNQLLKYVQKKAQKEYYKQQNKRIKINIKGYKSLNRPKIKNSSSRSKRTEKSHQEKNSSGGEPESDEGEPPIDSNFELYKSKAEV